VLSSLFAKNFVILHIDLFIDGYDLLRQVEPVDWLTRKPKRVALELDDEAQAEEAS